MRFVQGTAVGAGTALAGLIVWAATRAAISEDAATMTDLPWGVVALADLYLGLLFVGIWIGFRERGTVPILLWLAALVILGNVATAAYVVRAARAGLAHRSVEVFFLGQSAISNSEQLRTT